MGDRLRAGIPSRCVTSQLGQLSLATPPRGTRSRSVVRSNRRVFLLCALLQLFNRLFSRTTWVSWYQKGTRSSASTDRPREELYQSKVCQLLCNTVGSCTTNWKEFIDQCVLNCAASHDSLDRRRCKSSGSTVDDFCWPHHRLAERYKYQLSLIDPHDTVVL